MSHFRPFYVLVAIALTVNLSHVYAWSSTSIMPIGPIPNNTEWSYQYDIEATKNLLKKPVSLLKVNCNVSAVLRSLWYGEGKSTLLSLGILEGNYEYNVDFRSCSLWINNRSANQNSQKTLSEAQAIKTAQNFVKQQQGKIYSNLWKPVIINKSQRGNPVMYEKAGWAMQATPPTKPLFDDVEIIDGEEEEISREYVSYTVFFGATLQGISIYNQRGQPVWVSVDVNADGVTNFNSQLLPRKWSKAKSTKMTEENMISFINKWGNNPFYGSIQQVIFSKPERVYVLFTVPKNNTFETFIGDGIKLTSDIKLGGIQQYSMIVSVFEIWNNIR